MSTCGLKKSVGKVTLSGTYLEVAPLQSPPS